VPASFWIQLLLAVIVGIVALLRASADQASTAGTIAFLIFLAAIAYAFLTIKRVFDRIDRARQQNSQGDSE